MGKCAYTYSVQVNVFAKTALWSMIPLANAEYAHSIPTEKSLAHVD